VAEIIDLSTIRAVNLVEAVTKLIQKGGAREAVERAFDGLRLNVADWTESLAYGSTELASLPCERGFSLSDHACLTLARRIDAVAVTTDRAWEGLPLRVLTIR
jgi:PIN domain nuclease of toxin-antitoxin system